MPVQLSQTERALLLLDEHEDERDSLEVPFVLCQEGMAERLGLQVQNMSRTLSKMLEEGLISERLAHVSGAGRRRKVYRLASEGSSVISRLKEDLSDLTVRVTDAATAKDMPLRELLRMVSERGWEPSLLQLTDLAAAGPIRIGDLHVKKDSSTRPSTMAVGKPDFTPIVGRQTELARLRAAFWNGGEREVLIWGLPGMGKTSLGSALFEEAKEKGPCLWYSIKEYDSGDQLLGVLTAFLRDCGLKSINITGGERSRLFGPLVGDLAKWKGCIFIDDVHKAEASMMGAVNLIIEACKAQDGTRLVLMSRLKLDGFSENDPELLGIELNGLSAEASKELAKNLGMVGPLPRSMGSTRNPLLIQIAARSQLGDAGDEAQEYVAQIWKGLSEEERRCLRSLSVHRDFVPVSALPTDTDTVLKLRSKGMVLQRGSTFQVHDMLGEMILAMVPEEELRGLHAQAWRFYRGLEQNSMEGFFHLAHSGDARTFLAELDDAGESMDRPEELFGLIGTVSIKNTDAAMETRLRYWKGRALASLGRYDEAMAEYQAVIESVQKDKAMEGKALEGMADIHHMVERWDEALSTYRAALAEFENSDDIDSQVREWLNIGRTMRMRGDHTAALDAYRRAAELRPSDQRLSALIANNRAMVLWGAGQGQEAEDEFRRSVKIGREAKDDVAEGMALRNLADMYRENLRHEEMMLALKDASEAFLRAKAYDEFAETQVTMGRHLINSGRPQSGVDLLFMAMSRVQGTAILPGPTVTRATLGIEAMSALRDMGKSKEALALGKELLRMHRLPLDVTAKVEIEMALALKDVGSLDLSWYHLCSAERALTESGDQTGLTLVLIEKGEVEEQRGHAEEAAYLYREASWRAQGNGDGLGMGTSLEYLAFIIGLGTEEGRNAAERAIKAYDESGIIGRSERIRAAMVEAGSLPAP